MNNYQEKMQKEMFEGPIIPIILKISIPILISNIFNYVNLMVDAFFIARLDPTSSAPLAGTGLIYPLFFAIMTIASSTAVGINIITGRMIGEKKFDECKNIGVSGLVSTLAFGIPMIILIYLFGPGLIHVLAGGELSSAAAAYGIQYLYSLAPGLIIMILSQVYGGILLGEGLAYVSAIGFMGMTFINIVLDPILMFVLNLGVVGSGLATTISICFAFFYIMLFIYKGKSRIPLSFQLSRFNGSIVKEIIRIGMPQFLMTVSFYIIIAFYNKIITTSFSENAMNAWTLVERVDQILIIPITAIGGATTVFISQNFGRNQIDRIKKALKVNVWFVFLLCTIISIGYVLLAPWIFKRFTLIEEVINLASRQVLITAFSFGCMAVGWVTGSFFQATGKQMPAVMILYIRVLFTIAIGMLAIYVLELGIDAIFISVALGNLLCIPVSLLWARWHLKKIRFTSVIEK